LARPLRIEYPGAWYHVMNRGLEKRNIFNTNEHYECFLNLLKDTSRNYNVEIHAFCLMTNHYHLLIRTPSSNLNKAMRQINGIYTQRYNKLISRDGPLFRGRYKAILIEAESYLLQVSRYIHLNPVAANIVKDPKDFAWSSYRYYIGNTPLEWLHTSLLDLFGEPCPKEAYRGFVNAGIDEKLNNFYSNPKPSMILGSSNFSDQKISELNFIYKIEVNADIVRCKHHPTADQIIQCVQNYFNIEKTVIETIYPRKKNIERLITIYLLKVIGNLSLKKIAEIVKSINAVSISSSLYKIKKRIHNDKEMQIHILELSKIIFNLVSRG